MNSEKKIHLKIRVLSGPYAKQEITLPEGNVLIGNTSECDFIIHEPVEKIEKAEEEEQKEEKEKEEKAEKAEEEEQKEEKEKEEKTEKAEEEKKTEADFSDSIVLEITVSEGTATLQVNPDSPLPKILIAGKPVTPKDNQLVLPEKQSIEIGNIAFVLGKESDNLSRIKQTSEMTSGTVNKLLSNIKGLNKKIILIISAFIVIFALSTSAFFFFMFRNKPSETAERQAKIDPHELIAQQLAKKKYKNIKVKWLEDGKISLYGYIASAELKTDFTEELDAAGINYDDTIIDLSTLTNSVKLMLQSKNYKKTTVVPDDKRPGFVIITGKIVGDARWDNISTKMIESIKGLKGWHIISTQSNFSEELLMFLSQKKLSPFLSVVDRGDVLFVTGSLNAEQRHALYQAIDETKEQTNSEKKVIYQNIPLSGEIYPEFIPSPIASFGGDNDSAYFILKNGFRCNIGTMLPSGYAVVSIGRDGITLKRGGDLAHFPMPS